MFIKIERNNPPSPQNLSLPRCSGMNNLPHKMPRKALFVYTVCLLSLIPLIKGADPTFVSIDCPNSTLATTSTYAPNSTYQTNLNTLFSVLSSNSSNASNGFYNFTAGRSPPDIAYGLFLCRGDVAADVCRDCVVYATGDVVERCPRSKQVTIWYDQCLLRYSNQSIFAAADTEEWFVLSNTQNVTDATRFTEVLGQVIADVANRASIDDSGKKFATAHANYSALQSVYGLAQCTPDLSDDACNGCLLNARSKLPDVAKQGARVLFRSCYVRYEVYPFFNASIGAAPPPPSPVLSPPASSPGKTLFCKPWIWNLILNGYMSPEYVTRGQFSVKSDVYSFGVLVLEIISGKKINHFHQSDGARDLLSYAWKLWREGTPLDLMDPTLQGSYSRNEFTRCVHIALLCVQDDPDARPSMATVVLMLNSYSATLSLPQQPTFLGRSKPGSNFLKVIESDQSMSNSAQFSVNEASITELGPR
ncbi:hypothetical protein RHSIM_Rhsim13G0160100 [Rhododendron simsii]|uniref:Gnk2-homologous domain-containing protein n=1 Tax=Rhododendron simsii TaxID=118357 RepID=A0A834G0G5_RHOSS|nr:hypothetical protein RHSIM_Rhsim13G0160100 [Rhododendron simsii]